MDTTYGHAAYGCMICCGPEVPIMKYDPLDVPDLGFSNQTVLANNSCDGIQENLTGDFPTWWTGNTSIATTTKNQINGKAPGNTNHYAQSQLMYWGYKTYSDPCPESKPQASAGTNVCPTSVSVSSVTQEQLANVFPTYKTGIGAVTAMQVSPTTANWDGSPITEQLSMSSNSCPLTSPWPTSPCASSSTPFTVGAGGTAKDGTLCRREYILR